MLVLSWTHIIFSSRLVIPLLLGQRPAKNFISKVSILLIVAWTWGFRAHQRISHIFAHDATYVRVELLLVIISSWTWNFSLYYLPYPSVLIINLEPNPYEGYCLDPYLKAAYLWSYEPGPGTLWSSYFPLISLPKSWPFSLIAMWDLYSYWPGPILLRPSSESCLDLMLSQLNPTWKREPYLCHRWTQASTDLVPRSFSRKASFFCS